jgi:hypothetical protein
MATPGLGDVSVASTAAPSEPCCGLGRSFRLLPVCDWTEVHRPRAGAHCPECEISSLSGSSDLGFTPSTRDFSSVHLGLSRPLFAQPARSSQSAGTWHVLEQSSAGSRTTTSAGAILMTQSLGRCPTLHALAEDARVPGRVFSSSLRQQKSLEVMGASRLRSPGVGVGRRPGLAWPARMDTQVEKVFRNPHLTHPEIRRHPQSRKLTGPQGSNMPQVGVPDTLF